MIRVRRVRSPLLALLALAMLVGGGYAASALRSDSHHAAGEHLPAVNVRALPAEVFSTIGLIRAGGPFPYPQDGTVFANREHLLPRHPSGYYHEYTVPTPGEHDRGARRIIAGRPEEYYYTPDHYRSFERVDTDR